MTLHGAANYGGDLQAAEFRTSHARRKWWSSMDLAQLILSGLLFGGIYVLVAVGATLVFGVLDVVNFAHGEFLMIGMYASFWMYTLWGLDPYVSLPVTALLLFALGSLTERFILRPTIPRGHEVQVFVTLGLSLILQNAALMFWSANFRTVRVPHAVKSFELAGLFINFPRLMILLVTVLASVALHLFLRHTWMGKAIRATALDRNTARLMGIDVQRVYNVTFALGSALVGIAAALIMPLYPVYPQVGLSFTVVAFISVVMGGLGSIQGAAFAGLFIGVAEVLSGYYFGPNMNQLAYFILFVLVLVFRPYGLFGKSVKEA